MRNAACLQPLRISNAALSIANGYAPQPTSNMYRNLYGYTPPSLYTREHTAENKIEHQNLHTAQGNVFVHL